jgi:hypothetical protein
LHADPNRTKGKWRQISNKTPLEALGEFIRNSKWRPFYQQGIAGEVAFTSQLHARGKLEKWRQIYY